MASQRFSFSWDRSYTIAALPFGITERTAYVDVSPSDVTVRFGLWRLKTAPGNITGSASSGDYTFLKTAGPPHLSASDRGVTFATNGRSGICIEFDQPVKALDPFGLLKHPGATLTLAEPAAFAEAIGHPLPS